MASFLRIIGICEERGSGFDRIEEGMSALKVPAPKVEIGDDFTRTKLYYYDNLNKWTKEDRIRTLAIYTRVTAISMKSKYLMPFLEIDLELKRRTNQLYFALLKKHLILNI